MITVITADLVDSSLYSKDLLSRVLQELQKEFDVLAKEPLNSKFSIYRGDSFQGILKDTKSALRIALLLKTTVNKIPVKNKEKLKKADVKIALGLGEVDFKRESIAESNGQAFQFSGRTLDEMKNDFRRIRIKTPFEDLNAEFDVNFLFLDILMEKWSSASAEVVYYLLKNFKEQEIATKLGISQSAVNQRKKTAGWEGIAALLKRYEQVIKNKNQHGD